MAIINMEYYYYLFDGWLGIWIFGLVVATNECTNYEYISMYSYVIFGSDFFPISLWSLTVENPLPDGLKIGQYNRNVWNPCTHLSMYVEIGHRQILKYEPQSETINTRRANPFLTKN